MTSRRTQQPKKRPERKAEVGPAQQIQRISKNEKGEALYVPKKAKKRG